MRSSFDSRRFGQIPAIFSQKMQNPARKCRIWQIFPDSDDFFQIPMTFFFQILMLSLFQRPARPNRCSPLPENRLDRFFRRVGSKTDLARLMDSPNSSSLDLMSYCPWAKKKTSFREIVEALFSSFLQFHSLYFGYACSVGDAPMDLGAHIGI